MKRYTGYTITKVMVVLLVTLGALGAISYYSFRSYDEFTEAVDKLYNPGENTRLTEKILVDVTELDSRSRAYALTLSQHDLEQYVKKVEELRGEVDSLYLRSFGTNYHEEADTLRDLFQQKTQSFEKLIRLRISQSEREQDRSALRTLARTQKQITSDSMLVPQREVTTTTIPADTQKEKEEKEGLWKRIFGKSKKDTDQQEVVHQEKTIAYDSAYFERMETLISNVENVLRRAETERRQQSQLLTEQELQMVANDQGIIEQLRSIALKIKELEQEDVIAEKQETVAVARDSFSSVIWLAVCGGILSIILVYFVINDIWRTHRMQIQLSAAKRKAEHLANVKEEFLASMSHEIRTPLNSIIGFSEQIASSELDAEQRMRLNNVRSSSEHLLMLVNDILDFSKIESGKLRLEEIGFKVTTVVRESLATLEHLAQSKGIELRQEIDPALKDLVLMGDPIRLKQILINLASNGVKFTEDGFVKISAFIDSKTEDGVRLKLMVEDTGKGIDKSKLERIFEGFNQGDSSINRRYGGTGLGLTISKKLVQMQKGSIEVESEVGEGSCFMVYLDYRTTDKENYSGKFDLERVEINLKGRSLLLVDDDSMNHVLLKPSFERWGLEFDSAYDGDQGIAKASEKFYNYVLVDFQMPGKNGLEVVNAIRSEKAASQESNLILCTANAMVRTSNPKIMEKIDATLLKPFKEYEIAALLAGLAPPENGKDQQKMEEPSKYTLDNFNAYAGNDSLILREFINSFIETNREHLDLLQQYFEKKDYPRLGDTAHKMKNTFGQLKATEVLIHLVELEKLVHSNPSQKVVREHVSETRELAEEIFELLKEDLETLKNKDQIFSP